MESTQPFADLNNFIAVFDPILEKVKGARDALLTIREAEARGHTLATEIAARERALEAASVKLKSYETGIKERVDEAERWAATQIAQANQSVDAALAQRDARLKAMEAELAVAKQRFDDALASYDTQIVAKRTDLANVEGQLQRVNAALAETRRLVSSQR